jgi:CubicO group peptidase (beta-lactamase class C family)
MQCIERGLLNLDDDVAEAHLPEFKDIEILESMEDDGNGGTRPVLRKATRKITLRNLLTHTSGLAYEFTHPKLLAWRNWSRTTVAGRANAASKDIAVALRVPLVFEPGTAWRYGYGIDWAGLAVMRATQSTLEEYMAAHIWGPTDMRSTTFSPFRSRPDLLPRLARMTHRDAHGNLTERPSAGSIRSEAENVEFGGGGGCYGTANDYIKLLASLLGTASGKTTQVSGRPLLTAASLKIMFDQTISAPAKAMLNMMVFHPAAAGLAGNVPPGVSVTFGLGGLTNSNPFTQPTPRAVKLDLAARPTSGNHGEGASSGAAAAVGSGRSAGAMQWSGLPNCFWYISPRDGVCGCWFGQLLPPGDDVSLALYEGFEGAVLRELRGEVGEKGRL